MWLMTNIGFYSVVQKPNTHFLTVRARVKHDLDNLRKHYLPDLTESISHKGTDYPWRATTSHEAFAEALKKIVLDIRYDNFKNEVAAKQGKSRANRYSKVWSVLYDLKEDEPGNIISPKHEWPSLPSGKKVSYGGVVFSPSGKVLIREPKNHFDDYIWTFPKGKAERGETPEQTALRETSEETGVSAKIISPIIGDFHGGTGIDRYYLMSAPAVSGGVSENDAETESIRWVTPAEASRLISLTTNLTGKKRDLAVLAAALATQSKSK